MSITINMAQHIARDMAELSLITHDINYLKNYPNRPLDFTLLRSVSPSVARKLVMDHLQAREKDIKEKYGE